MKSLLFYFVEFFDDGSILLKVYPDDCKVGRSDQRPIITISQDESTFSAKLWSSEGMNFG